MKAFLGGTCNETDWRDRLIKLLKIEYFNPVITDREWTEEDRQNEIKERSHSDFVIYVLTPRMSGLYSIAEVVDDSNKKPEKTILYVQQEDTSYEGKRIVYTKAVKLSLQAISDLVKSNGANVFSSLEEIAEFVNSK